MVDFQFEWKYNAKDDKKFWRIFLIVCSGFKCYMLNGNSWVDMGISLGYSGIRASSMAVYNSELYVGGTTYIGNNTVKGIAKWNGSSWSI